MAATKLKVKKGDKVVVLAGRDRGKQGEVIEAMPKENRVRVRGVNMVKKHQRQTPTQTGGILEIEAPIHVSNVAHVDPKTGGPTRIGYKFVGEGDARRKVRYAKKSGEQIDL
ncbi:MAG TPA: 50S ribosomal protein L24 [Azospirillaceae bacterium]|nr:50S ribosomal protein L24 [Azospirillaceae bacterium]